ncbi:MAG: STAS/SEC14 domain-containing protein [Polyangiales bacterium]|nr:STAS/SEC14 domain-containing protein [Myxococcales bacterium]MCB9659526.1 STAS/SEC14 domain-containing protein [Sandaracinaceae bacterium]
MSLETDRSEWPLLVVRWPEGVVTDESLDRYLAESVQDLSRRTVHCVMHDSRTAMGLSAAQRRRMAAHLAQHEHAIRQWTSGVAIVSPSAVIRGMITAVNWITGTPCPQRTFATEPEARAWLRDVHRQKTHTEAPFAP